MAGVRDDDLGVMDGNDSIQCVQKLMEIETVKNATETVTKLYVTVKGSNRLFTFYFVTIEKGFSIVSNGFLEPMARILQRPIKVVDNYACVALDGAQQTFPIITERPRTILKSGCMSVMKTGLAQALMTIVEKLLYTAEISVTLLPEISVVDVDADENEDKQMTESVIGSVLGNIKQLYGYATTPLHVTSRVLRAGRRTVRKLKNEASGNVEERKVSSEPQYQRRSFLGRLLNLPVTGFHYIGMLAEQRAILNRQREPNLGISPEACSQQLDEVEQQWLILEQVEVPASRISTDSEDEDEVIFNTPNRDQSQPHSQNDLSESPPLAVSTPEPEQVRTSSSKKPVSDRPKIAKPIKSGRKSSTESVRDTLPVKKRTPLTERTRSSSLTESDSAKISKSRSRAATDVASKVTNSFSVRTPAAATTQNRVGSANTRAGRVTAPEVTKQSNLLADGSKRARPLPNERRRVGVAQTKPSRTRVASD